MGYNTFFLVLVQVADPGSRSAGWVLPSITPYGAAQDISLTKLGYEIRSQCPIFGRLAMSWSSAPAETTLDSAAARQIEELRIGYQLHFSVRSL